MVGYIENPKVSDNRFASTTVKRYQKTDTESKNFTQFARITAALQQLATTVGCELAPFSGLCCTLEKKWPGPKAYAGQLWGQDQDPPEHRLHPTLPLLFQTHPPPPLVLHRRCGRSTPWLWSGGREGRRAEASAPILEDRALGPPGGAIREVGAEGASGPGGRGPAARGSLRFRGVRTAAAGKSGERGCLFVVRRGPA